jgi:glycosyltransferase involved in cell wall biosynthesis
MSKTRVLLLGPDRRVISGVATHLNLLFGSELARRFELRHFQIGSEGRAEGRLGTLARLVASPFQLAAAFARSGAEILHVNTSLSPKSYWRDLMYVAVAKLCGARVVYQVHGGSVADLWQPGLRATLRWPDAVVVLAQSELDEIRELVPQQNVAVVPNAIDCAPYLQLRRPAPAQAGEGATPLRLVHIGRLIRSKGVFEMVEGLALAQRQGVVAQLVIAGDGPAAAELREAVDRLGLAAQVTFAGPTFGEAKVKLLGEADVLVFPTYHREGLPYALLEAMAAGLVPITTRVAAIPDVVTEGVHGLFVPPRDPQAIAQALITLDADRGSLARMGAASRERVLAAYSIARLENDFAALYRSLRAASVAPRAAS